jgi:hypothetical protein
LGGFARFRCNFAYICIVFYLDRYPRRVIMEYCLYNFISTYASEILGVHCKALDKLLLLSESRASTQGLFSMVMVQVPCDSMRNKVPCHFLLDALRLLGHLLHIYMYVTRSSSEDVDNFARAACLEVAFQTCYTPMPPKCAWNSNHRGTILFYDRLQMKNHRWTTKKQTPAISLY